MREWNKIIIFGWDNVSGSIAEAIRYKFPECEIYCMDIQAEEFNQAHREGLLNSIPTNKSELYENADIILFNHNYTEILRILKSINSFLDPETYILDLLSTKANHYDNINDALEKNNPYISSYAFLDEKPFGIRRDLLKDRIVAVISDDTAEVLNAIKDFWGIMDAKIIPTSSDFFDEIIASTMQIPDLLSIVYSHILQRDGWADTLFFGFYNKILRNLVNLSNQDSSCLACDVVENKENVHRTISFMIRELQKLDRMLQEENISHIEEYINSAKQFKSRI